jgi:hypothetical protein
VWGELSTESLTNALAGAVLDWREHVQFAMWKCSAWNFFLLWGNWTCESTSGCCDPQSLELNMLQLTIL